MNLKILKKNIKQQLFNLSIFTNKFSIFEPKHLLFPSNLSLNTKTETFSKQIFNKLKNKHYMRLKFPIKIRAFNSSEKFFLHFVNLKINNQVLGLYSLKIDFLMLEKNINSVNFIYGGKKNINLLKNIILSFIKRFALINLFDSIVYPFFRV